MRYRALGGTDLLVSELGLGAAPLGGVFGAMGQNEANEIVRLALEMGINYFDTAPYYGGGKVSLLVVPSTQHMLSEH